MSPATMTADPADFEAVDADRRAGAYLAELADNRHRNRPRQRLGISARDALQLLAHEARIVWLLGCDLRQGLIPTDADWIRFAEAVRCIDAMAGGVAR